MTEHETVEISPVATQIYGFRAASRSALINYGRALLAVAGGDRAVSAREMEWLIVNFGELLQLPGDIIEVYEAFNYRAADLKAIVSEIRFETNADIPRMILYDAIRMSRADEEYHEQEIQAVLEAASVLDLNLSAVRSLERLVETERTVADLRLALFEVSGDVQADELPTEENRIRHNAWIKEHFGYRYTTPESIEAFLLTLLVVNGMNGDVGEAEFRWLEEFSRAAGVPDQFVAGLRSVDYHRTDLGDLLDKFVVDRKMNMPRILIYLSIQMARADGRFTARERDSVYQAARSLGEENAIVVEIEQLLELERSLEGFRKSLFRVTG